MNIFIIPYECIYSCDHCLGLSGLSGPSEPSGQLVQLRQLGQLKQNSKFKN